MHMPLFSKPLEPHSVDPVTNTVLPLRLAVVALPRLS